MKKSMGIWILILLMVLTVLASCATISQKSISKGDLPALKGRWEGTRTAGSGTTAYTELEIYNDTIPLKGKLTAYNVIVRTAPERARTVTLEFQNGGIKDGNLVMQSGENIFQFSLYSVGGQMKLEGDYYLAGAKGKLALEKK